MGWSLGWVQKAWKMTEWDVNPRRGLQRVSKKDKPRARRGPTVSETLEQGSSTCGLLPLWVATGLKLTTPNAMDLGGSLIGLCLAAQGPDDLVRKGREHPAT